MNPSLIVKILSLAILIFSIGVQNQSQYCEHPIFCNNKILQAVSKSKYFPNDFKEFVDLVLKVPVQTALQSFEKDSLQDFLEKNFAPTNSILQPVNLPDYVQKPSQFSKIKNQQLRVFAYDLNKRWNQLARKVNLNFSSMEGVSCILDCSTFLEQLNEKTIIIPGGRFREGYYWDSYWIVKGLIASNMLQTAQNIVRNFLLILKTHGFIPNGFRKYYLNRSQPPFLTFMVKQVTEALFKQGKKQKAQTLEKDAFMLLVGQNNFWQTFKVKDIKVKNQNLKVNIYSANTTSPRPQSYRQDLSVVAKITNQTQRARVLHCISSMAQSGWDFSSRWFKNPNDILSTIMDQIIPTDLNTILGMNEAYLAKLAQKSKRSDLHEYFLKSLKQRKRYFSLIKEKDNIYPDFKPINSSSIYPSDYYPHLLQNQEVNVDKIFNDTVNPVSSKSSNGQQWDSPNVWAPNNWILHEILPHKKAFQFAQQWVSTVYCSWKKQSLIYQKYRNDKLGVRGQGGQYQVQTGFGWTNGLALYYLMLYSQQLAAPDINKCN